MTLSWRIHPTMVSCMLMFVAMSLCFSPCGKLLLFVFYFYLFYIYFYFVTDLLITGEILAAWVNTPGSWHDSHVAVPIYAQLQRGHSPWVLLVADTAFPWSSDQISGGSGHRWSQVRCFPVTHSRDRQLCNWTSSYSPIDKQQSGACEHFRALLDICDSLLMPMIQSVINELWRLVHTFTAVHSLCGYKPNPQCLMNNMERGWWWRFMEWVESMLFGEVRRRDRVSLLIL